MSNYWISKSGRVVKETRRCKFNSVVYVYGESVAGGWCGQLRLDRLRPATPLDIARAVKNLPVFQPPDPADVGGIRVSNTQKERSMQLPKMKSLKKMNRYAAWQKANLLWGPVASQGINLAHVRIRQKKVTNRFEVGYYTQATSKLTVMGAGPSWEVAFEQAARNESTVISEQTRHDVAASVARHAEIEERLVPVLPDSRQWTTDLDAIERAHVARAVEQSDHDEVDAGTSATPGAEHGSA